jgi:hypothetical protein
MPPANNPAAMLYGNVLIRTSISSYHQSEESRLEKTGYAHEGQKFARG